MCVLSSDPAALWLGCLNKVLLSEPDKNWTLNSKLAELIQSGRTDVVMVMLGWLKSDQSYDPDLAPPSQRSGSRRYLLLFPPFNQPIP
ncbi:unnamed protein product [Gadus morhua 'NCC']